MAAAAEETEKDTMLSANNDGGNEEADEKSEEGVRMKKELGLMEGVSIILGIIVGSGKIRINE